MRINATPTDLIDQLRAWFHPKDRSVVMADDCFIEGDQITKPANPRTGRRRLYAKTDCWYDLDSAGTETGLCVSGVDPAGHTHSKLVASDGAPDPALSADANGFLSAAVQPLFSAYKSSSTADVTGDGTYYTVIFDTEIADRGSNYNNSTGVFMAPVTGKYLFVACVFTYGFDVAHTGGFLNLLTSNRRYYGNYTNPYLVGYAGAGGSYQFLLDAVIADMDAADTAQVEVFVTGGTKTVDVYGAAEVYTGFQGYLLM